MVDLEIVRIWGSVHRLDPCGVQCNEGGVRLDGAEADGDRKESGGAESRGSRGMKKVRCVMRPDFLCSVC